MKNMKRNLTFVSLLAILVMALSFSSALATNIDVEFKNVDLSAGAVVAVSPGEVVPVLVLFDADDNASDVVLEVEIKGRNGVSVSKDISDVEDGSTYSNLLKLKLPEHADDLSEELALYVTVSSKTKSDKVNFPIKIKVQRESYDLEVLSVDYGSKVSAGNTFPISVVAKNVGYNRADDVYVVASIPSLGISTRGYVGDIIPVEDYTDYDDEEDSVEEVVYLQVPAGSESGIYELVVKVYNKDSSVEVSKLLSVEGVAPKTDGEAEVLKDEPEKMSTSVIALTVIIAIIFVVLLIVLVVLLTKKEKPIEEVETSYY